MKLTKLNLNVKQSGSLTSHRKRIYRHSPTTTFLIQTKIRVKSVLKSGRDIRTRSQY